MSLMPLHRIQEPNCNRQTAISSNPYPGHDAFDVRTAIVVAQRGVSGPLGVG